MPTTDLDYFRERNLDRATIKDFYESLPTHLQNRFKECNRANIVWENVLQGYRGPSNLRNGASGDSEELKSSHGIQEIKFWWGIRKDLNYFPLFGSYLFGANRIVQSFSGQLDWSSLYFDSETGECLSHNKDDACEKLNARGCHLFNEGKYSEAAQYHKNAYRSCSSSYRKEQTFKNNLDEAQSELDAINLNAQGDHSFMEGKYTEAYSKYLEAYNKSQVSTQRDKYGTNIEKVQSEIDATNLGTQGYNLFIQGNYSEAHSKYQEAYKKSSKKLFNGYWRDKAKSEMDAISLNSQGDDLFRQGRYIEAQSKYQEAYNKSQVTTQHDKYGTNRDKAQSEIYAISLNSQGDDLFRRGKYSEAQCKYQEAYNISQITKEKKVYRIKNDKAQTFINKLSILLTLWNKAWDAENDMQNDRSGEAKEIFEKVLSESKDSLKTFPGRLIFKQYETLASLKIEGNEFFNRGLESQQDGIKCLEEAQELKQQQKLKLAHLKFQEAKDAFSDAQRKFTIKNQTDKRFLSCIEFVQEQLNEVIESIAITEPHTLNQGLNKLNINKGTDNREANAYESNIEGQLG